MKYDYSTGSHAWRLLFGKKKKKIKKITAQLVQLLKGADADTFGDGMIPQLNKKKPLANEMYMY